MRFWLILTISIVLTVVAAVITGVADVWTETGTAAQVKAAQILRTESLAVTGIAGLCWLGYGLRLYLDTRDRERDRALDERLAQEYERREELLLTTLGRLVRTATRPFEKLHGLR